MKGNTVQPRSILAAFAHPDDEAFGSGGTLARYAAEGARITLVCATRGEVGEISDPTLATPETLGTVREAELQAAAQALGITDVRFLGYRDSGMAGTPENQDPRAYANAPAEEVVPQLVRIIREVRPQVVITFDPSGGYGHPDHIAIHHHTVAAFHVAGDAASHLDAGAAWQPSRLFYAVIPRSTFSTLREQLVAAGVDTSQFDRFSEAPRGWPDDQIHAVLDVASTVAAKWNALNAHRTQFGPENIFRKLPEPVMQGMFSREYFALAWPEPQNGHSFDDLFGIEN
jgi:N-acetyl-1-D-myo-inositol-2-amino-2-deoxy-alpha-D-glucopyranoside deacetylase